MKKRGLFLAYERDVCIKPKRDTSIPSLFFFSLSIDTGRGDCKARKIT